MLTGLIVDFILLPDNYLVIGKLFEIMVHPPMAMGRYLNKLSQYTRCTANVAAENIFHSMSTIKLSNKSRCESCYIDSSSLLPIRTHV